MNNTVTNTRCLFRPFRKRLPLFCNLTFRLLWLTLVPLAAFGQNPVADENALPGSPSSEWEISGAGDLSIQGFATDISINTGGTVDFKIDVKAPATNFSIRIYRLGYYGGNGARLIADLGNAFTGTAQPDPLYDIPTGKTDCSNWSVSASWTATGAVSGLYIAKLTRNDDNGSSHIAFVVRNDAGNSDLLFKTSDATWQAYNGYGGNSLYVNNSGTAVPGFNHATKVSYDRPFITRNGGGGGGASEDWLFNAEYPMIRWLERNGYDVSYATDVDMDRDATPVTPAIHKVLMSVGHDEYWSANARAKFETARSNGVHLAFFSGNEIYWKTRWEDNHRTLVCYKEGTLGENVCGGDCDPTNTWTGLWRDGCSSTAPDGCNPENALSGQISWADEQGALLVPDTYKDLRFWRNTGVAALGSGQTASLGGAILGYEFDHEQYQAYYPPGRITMSGTTLGGVTHKLSLYRHTSGALVFGAGTVQWSWGLDENHDRGNDPAEADIQQATKNLLADMGVQAGTPQTTPTLTAASASTDATPPTSVIANPAEGASLSTNNTVIISGSATDGGGGVVAGVEVSVDGGATWQPATGAGSWTYSWTPVAEGTYVIKSRGFDDSGNIEAAGTAPADNALTVSVGIGPAPDCPCTIWNASTVPGVITDPDNQAVELGVKFRTTADGYITGVRFYKSPTNTGTHTGNLWSVSGVNLAQATFTGETASGWQEVIFANPVQVTAGVTYVASYHTTVGQYSQDGGYFSPTGTSTYYIEALADGEDGSNGVYTYSPASAFPTASFDASNYWVDVVFETEVGPDVSPPTVSGTSPSGLAGNVNINATVNAIFNEAVDPATVDETTFELRDNANNPVPATVSYSVINRTATLTPATALIHSSVYTATVKGGVADPRVKDLAGNALENDYVWTFSTADPPPPPPTEGPGGPVLLISAAANPFSRYPVEILRAQGFNAFTAMDVSEVSASIMNDYDVIILGEIPLSATAVTDLTAWVNAGGTLIALRPDAQLTTLLGITATGGTLSEGYLAVNTGTDAGAGITGQTLQFHGTANLYTLNGAEAVATLYSNATAATAFPAVTRNLVGSNGGQAIAFAYDLAKSVVLTRQGNPAWAGQNRDGQAGPERSDDMFFGDASFDPQTDWVNLDKVAIPQADEQQHLLSNLITLGSLHRKPLPRIWFLPKGLKAAVVMTGDDHANNGTTGRFNQYKTLSGANDNAAGVADWLAIRGSSYIYPNTPITPAQVLAFQNDGFEIGLHLNTGCSNWTESSLNSDWNTQWSQLTANFPGIDDQVTHRTHCIAWSDWATQPKVQAARGIRLDVNYYYWPDVWVLDRPGMFTGSGMPMRFADLDGTLIDCYQVTTQLTDESGITYSTHINSLLDKAIGPEGYYGVFCANMHTDANGGNSTNGSDAIINAAVTRSIPVVSAKQMLEWLDGRNNSAFGAVTWSGNELSFTISAASGSRNMRAMVPVVSESGALTSITYDGAPVATANETIKGVEYAFFDATLGGGTYIANYNIDVTPPVISNIVATPAPDGLSAVVTWQTDEPADSRVDFGVSPVSLVLTQTDNAQVTSHSVTLNGLTPGVTYYFRVASSDNSNNSATEPAPPSTLDFTTPVPVNYCFTDQTAADFNAGSTAGTYVSDLSGGEVILQPAAAAEFTILPPAAEWQSFAWTGGTSTVTGGALTVDGARFNTQPEGTTFGPGSSLEFLATFGAGSFQHIGFGGGSDGTLLSGIFTGQNAWAMFSTGNTTNTLKARTSTDGSTSVDIDIPGSFLGVQHLYRIDWKSDGSFDYYIDNTLVHAEATVIAAGMRPAISDYNAGGSSVSVNWIRLTPYVSSGTFESGTYDAGGQKEWGAVTWTADLPAGTSLAVSVRTGNTLPLSGAYTPIAASGDPVGATARYIQYKADLATTDGTLTPVLDNLSIACSDPGGAAPAVIADPGSQTLCEGENASFASDASGSPTPAVQWQESTDGNSWSDIDGAVTSPFVFTPALTDHNKQYRAVWTNDYGTATSAPAILTVNPTPQVVISPVSGSVCQGDNLGLQVNATAGTGPFDLVIDGLTYPGVTDGQILSVNGFAPEAVIWPGNPTPANPSVTDNQPIEIGVKFRSTTGGFAKGIRFYKGLTNTGAHTGNLWSAAGDLLSSAVFTNESADGWQQVYFINPVAIQANTTYIASYFSAGGYFAIDAGGLTTGVNSGPLTALAAGTDGPNGVYKYGGGFPDGGSNANYWVDVIFEEALPAAQTYTYNLTGVTDANTCSSTGAPLSSAAITVNPQPAGALSVEDALCDGDHFTLTFTAGAGTGPFDLIVNGTPFNNINSGDPFDSGVPAAGGTTATIWSPAETGGSQAIDNENTELAVRFTADIPGSITGIRFYKTGNNSMTGATVSLWANGNPTALATAPYAGDDAPGWKQVDFPTAVPIPANTEYRASYFSPNPNYYAYSAGGLSAPVSNGPLTALASAYNQPGTGYPGTASTANYWVDVVFASNSGQVFNLTSIADATGCTVTGTPINSVSGVLIPDSEAPAITCASNAVRNTDAGVCTYTIIGSEFDLAATSDNCGVASVTHDYNGGGATLAGQVLPPGLTIVTWTVLDINGFSSTCTTEIDVVPQDNDGDGVACDLDCDDDDPDNYPGNLEVYDGQDNDCDGLVDGDDPDVGGQTLNGHANLSAACGGKTVTITVYMPGTTSLVTTKTATVNVAGDFAADGIAPGVYDIFIKTDGFLRKGLAGQTINPGLSGINFGSLFAGDIDNNNNINGIDLSAIVAAYNTADGDAAYNPLADFDCSGTVGGLDLSALIANYNLQGDEPGTL